MDSEDNRGCWVDGLAPSDRNALLLDRPERVNVTSHPFLRSLTDWTEDGATYRQLGILLLVAGMAGIVFTIMFWGVGGFD